jgi:hypothetical protein
MVTREPGLVCLTQADNLDGVTEHLPHGILIVKTQRVSVSGTSSEDLAKACQCRRALRMQKKGLPTDEKLSLSFSCIDIREYPLCIGDNPGGKGGTPLSIEWTHVSEVRIGLEEYETSRSERRDHSSLWMKASIRDDILKRSGYSIKDIRIQTKPVNIDRAQRRRTLETLSYGWFQELQETISRKIMNILTFGARKRKEREMMKSFASLDVGKGLRKESVSSKTTKTPTLSLEFET